ncbi:MAG: anaerobic ribonucleoside-triphosphate reductase [Victivallaceae bacterium]
MLQNAKFTLERVCGYFRPVANWNRGKQQEFVDRKTFNIGKAVKNASGAV